MTVKRLIEILLKAPGDVEVGFDNEFGDLTSITHVDLKNGKVQLGSGYSDEANFWHPGNGNLGADVRILGHDWPKQES